MIFFPQLFVIEKYLLSWMRDLRKHFNKELVMMIDCMNANEKTRVDEKPVSMDENWGNAKI
jgi:hypothetical protein